MQVIISRDYRGEVGMGEIERFMPELLVMEEEGRPAPIVHVDGTYFFFTKHASIFFVAGTRRNVNSALVFSFLHKAIQLFKDYFRELEEESIRDNFVILYELFDEIMDFGFPQTTEVSLAIISLGFLIFLTMWHCSQMQTKVLQTFITQQGHKLQAAPRPSMAVTNSVSWRVEGIKHRTNEVFLNVVESVNMVVSAAGAVVRHDITGAIRMRTCLSGMPELRLGLNNKFSLDSSRGIPSCSGCISSEL
jgi:AP-1 complex subunit mu